jgi:hypothetical protein
LESHLGRFTEHAPRRLGDRGAKAMLHPRKQEGVFDADRHLVIDNFD